VLKKKKKPKKKQTQNNKSSKMSCLQVLTRISSWYFKTRTEP